MTAALTITPADLVLRVASATVGASEVPPNSNAGPFVEACQAVTGNRKGDAWCASFVARVGVKALGTLWPVRKTGGCKELGAWATASGVLREMPEPGDIFLVWYAEKGRFAHTGFVLSVVQGRSCRTIEGNTSGGGSREGWLVAERLRVFTPEDRFIRWADLVRP